MDSLTVPQSILSLLVVINFLFLLGLTRFRLSERQQTGAWVAFTIVFFSVCGLLLKSR